MLWGLALDGAEGAQRVLEILLEEFDTRPGAGGAPVAAQLDRGFVTPAPWVTERVKILVTGIRGYIGSGSSHASGATATSYAASPADTHATPGLGVPVVTGDAVTGRGTARRRWTESTSPTT